MSEIDSLLRADLRGQSPYGAPQLDVAVRLNTNENPHPPSAELAAEIGAAATRVALELNRYPDRDAVALRTDLAAYLTRQTGLSPEAALTTAQVWAANGSNEILQQLLQAFGGPGRQALGFEPSYSMHRLIALGTSTGWVPAQRAADFTLTPEAVAEAVKAADPAVVFLCSPNNPTGTALDLDVVEAAYSATRGLLVVDEAYAEFSSRPSAIELLPGRPRLVVTRTMSKAFAFAGARVGYLAADPAVVDAVQLVRLPYHLSALTQAAARAALARAAELLDSVEAVKAQRDRIVDELRAAGLTVIDSDANFVLFGGLADSRATWQQLLDAGVLVRDVGMTGWLRVTAGTEPETTAFLAAVAALDVKEHMKETHR
jgi:histidinol-phosphate aminotransferase